MVIRNHEGQFVAGSSKRFDGLVIVEIGEAIAAREGFPIDFIKI